jgi:hypothetical protein
MLCVSSQQQVVVDLGSGGTLCLQRVLDACCRVVGIHVVGSQQVSCTHEGLEGWSTGVLWIC